MAQRASQRSRSSTVGMDSSRHVATEIRRRVEREKLKPGDRIGTEQELAAQFGVSRPTLREGLRLLASTHLIRSTQGRGGGIFVASTPNEGIGRSLSDSIATLLATDSVSLSAEEAMRNHHQHLVDVLCKYGRARPLVARVRDVTVCSYRELG